jgi:hypothetical protein
MNTHEIVGMILIFCGIIYTFLRGLGILSSKEIEEIEIRIFKIKGGPGLILTAFGVILFLTSQSPIIDSNGPGDKLTPSPTVTFAPISSPSSTSTKNIMDCFPSIPENRKRVMEAGKLDLEIVGSLEPKNESMAITFTDNRTPIGAIRFSFYSNIYIFKIESVFDSNCQQIEGYENIDRSGDKNILQNWDTLQIQFGGDKYIFRPGYDGTIITASFQHTV